jgi:predicted MPP superfamily phosphohydrolase
VEQFNQDLVTSSLIERVEKLVRDDGRSFDLIFITGDLARGGKEEDYQVVKVFCRKLLEVTQVTSEHLFLVPGNHDVNRDSIGELHSKSLYGFENLDEITKILTDKDAFPILMRKFKAFNSFATQAMGRHLFTERNYFYAEAVSICKEGVQGLINVMGLNSALFAGYDGDEKKKLAFGLPQVEDAINKLDNKDPLTIVLSHHPFICFHPADKVCQNRLIQMADLILTGHKHEPDNVYMYGATGQTILISAGASLEKRESENSFNIGEIDLYTGGGQVKFYNYLPSFRSWGENTDANPYDDHGRFLFTIKRIEQQTQKAHIGPRVEQLHPRGFIFFCYAREDQEFALKMAQNLKDRGVDIWIDQWNIRPGADWDREIDKAIDDCGKFLIILSPNSSESYEVRCELRTALDGKKKIFPILFKKCQIPRQLRVVQYSDFTRSDSDDDINLEALISILK